MLSDRKQRVLAALIEEYVANAIPVGSRTLTERYKLGVSPATVRNELSHLEYEGYIISPHTSSGRIPTDYGYRAFVNNLLAQQTDTFDPHFHEAVESLRSSANELDDLLEKTTAALTKLTDCLSVVLAPSVLGMRLKQISLISLTSYRALIVIVTEEGQVLNRSLDFPDGISSEELASMQTLLSDALVGMQITEIEKGLSNGIIDAMVNPSLAYVFREVLKCLQESEVLRSRHMSVSALLNQPEFALTHKLLPLMQILEDDTVLLHILDEAASGGQGTQVSIGSENSHESLNGVSVVANHFGRGDSAGIVAVIGPTRMKYSRVIRAVRVASAALDDAISQE